MINIEPWKMEELKSIAIIGFKKLQVPVNEQVIERMAAESLTSPQLMQSICLNLCLLSEVDETHHLNEDLLEQSYKFTTINLPYKEVIQKIQAGPSTRGQKRKNISLSLMKSSMFMVSYWQLLHLIPLRLVLQSIT